MAKFKVQAVVGVEKKKSASLKTKKWRVKEREIKGDKQFRKGAALVSKLYRSTKDM